VTAAGGDDQNIDLSGSNENSLAAAAAQRQRLFTVTELICAVIGTHIGTIVVCLIALPLIYRYRRRVSARHKHERAVTVAGLHRPSPPAYGTTTSTATSTNNVAPTSPIPVGIGLDTSGSVGVDYKPLMYRPHPQNTLPSIPAESVYLNGTPYSTIRRQHQKQQQQLPYSHQQQPQYSTDPPQHLLPQHQHFLTEYLLTAQRR
jgi:hypothetical protein